MLAPGMLFDANGRVITTVGVGLVAQFISQGIGFMNDGSLALDINPAPVPISFCKGIAQNASGACFASGNAPATTDVFVEGIDVSILGQIMTGPANPTSFTNGNPITGVGKFSQTN